MVTRVLVKFLVDVQLDVVKDYVEKSSDNVELGVENIKQARVYQKQGRWVLLVLLAVIFLVAIGAIVLVFSGALVRFTKATHIQLNKLHFTRSRTL